MAQVERTYRQGDYVLVLKGAIPTGSGGKFCNLWPGMTFDKAVERYAARAAFIMGVGTCTCYGGCRRSVMDGSPAFSRNRLATGVVAVQCE